MKRIDYPSLPTEDCCGWAPRTQPPDLGALDFLGRLPIPLRRGFKAGLDRAAAGRGLSCCFLSGGEWFGPFDGLEAAAENGRAPGMVLATFGADVIGPAVRRYYAARGSGGFDPAAHHPACVAAGLPDPLGVCRLVGVIPFVFLVDARRLDGRPAPRCWEDLLHPRWRGEIVFGGWRARPHGPYEEHNTYVTLALRREFGDDGLAAFAANVRGLLHNVRMATLFGSGSAEVGAVAILPWMQAAMCPRRDHVRVVWPEDGALAMPTFVMRRADARARTAPLAAYVCGPELGAAMTRDHYPSARPDAALPPGARFKWPGWEFVRRCDFSAALREASARFLAALLDRERACAC